MSINEKQPTGLTYCVWDIYQQIMITKALSDLSDSDEATDEYLRLLITQWIPCMHKIHDPNRYGYN